jgi:DNA-directed RNA polymerase subunit alpha
MPKTLKCDEGSKTATYAKFVAEPFEAGYGSTIGNSMRRVLLSSLEGASITSVKLDNAPHEFGAIPGIVEDVTEIVMNLKKVLLRSANREPHTVFLSVNKAGEVTAGDIKSDQVVEVLNPDLHLFTIDKKMKFEAELEVRIGRGFISGDENKKPEQTIGIIPIDSIFSPVRRVRYAVENTRLGQKTDYDKLILEIWTDGRLTPDDALVQASNILQHHLDVFTSFGTEPIVFEEDATTEDDEHKKLRKQLNMSVNEIELSVRAANCLNNANIVTVGQLAMKSEAEMLKYRNFGKKSLKEIKDKLGQLGLALGMKVDTDLLDVAPAEPPPEVEK